MCEQCAGRIAAGVLAGAGSRPELDDSDEATILGLFKFTPLKYYEFKKNGNRIIFAGCIRKPRQKREHILILFLDNNKHLHCVILFKRHGFKMRFTDWSPVSTSVAKLEQLVLESPFKRNYDGLEEELLPFLRRLRKEACDHRVGSGRKLRA